MKKVVIVDYELSNMFSVQNACKVIGINAELSNSPEIVSNADALILPGVGSFERAMNNLGNLQLIDPIKDSIHSGKPFFGVCLGLQLLFTESEEFGSHKGLDIIKGKIRKFPEFDLQKNVFKVPQICWNSISIKSSTKKVQSPLVDIENGEFMYFVHSYYAIPDNQEDILTETNYGEIDYCSGILKNNIFAVQFHPEKSGETGLKIYNNWARQNQLI